MPSWLTAVSHRHGQQTKWVCHTNIQQPTNTLECYVLVACGQLATQHINFRDPPKDTSSTVAAGVQLQLRLQLPLDKNTCQSLWTVQGKTDTTTDLKFPPTANLVKCEPFAQVTDKLKKLVWKYLAFIPSDEKAWTQTILDVKCYTPTFQSVKHEHVPTPQWDVTEMCRGAADKGRLAVAMEPWWFTASAKAEESNLLQLINDRLSLSRGNQTQTCIPENEMERERGCGGSKHVGMSEQMRGWKKWSHVGGTMTSDRRLDMSYEETAAALREPWSCRYVVQLIHTQQSKHDVLLHPHCWDNMWNTNRAKWEWDPV